MGNSGSNVSIATISADAAGVDDVERRMYLTGATVDNRQITPRWMTTLSQSGHTIQGYYGAEGGTAYVDRRSLTVDEG